MEGNDAPGIDLDYLAGGEVELHEIAAGVDEQGARAGELLQNETLTAEEAGAEFPHHGDVELDGRLSEKEGIALRQQRAAGRQVENLYAPGIVAGKADFAGAIRPEIRQKQRFPANGAA